MSAIVMQHRAPQACSSCRKLKRKCIYNSAQGKCDRCYESGKSCVYEANQTTSPTAPVATPSFSITNAAPPGNPNATPDQYGQPMYLNSFGTLTVPSVDISDGSQQNAPSDGGRMAGMGLGNEHTTYHSNHVGRGF